MDIPFASPTYFSESESAGQLLCKKFVNIHYLDYTGDCSQDIIMHCTDPTTSSDYFQFLRMQPNGKYEIFKNVYQKMSKTVLNLAASDISKQSLIIDFDGLVDLVALFQE